MKSVSFDYTHALDFLRESEIENYGRLATDAAKLLEERRGPGNDYLGWMDLPVNYDRNEYARIKAAAERIREQSEVLIVIGIGGSYLGARAAIQFLSSSFYNRTDKKSTKIYFAGTNLSSDYHCDLLDLVEEKDFSINMISKSGTTTEPAVAFRFFRGILEKKYGKEEARKRIYATTDKSRGALKTLADREGYETFVVPDDVGGRFSVMTPVGLLPLAVAGIDTDRLLEGAADARALYRADFADNQCYQYAAVRNALLRRGKYIELMVSYEPRLRNISEWWRQLFGESEGKDGKGIFPTYAQFTTDLHSIGQYIQDGKRNLFETLLNIEEVDSKLIVREDPDNLDGLNYLAGQSMEYINRQAIKGTIEAHIDGGVPNLVINIPKAAPYHLGWLFYFFEKSCAVSGYMLGVNPFDQPGVEDYKRNMFRLLGKPGM